jgi:hypothetical protein
MKFKICLLILLLFFACNLKAQEKYTISWDYKDLSFKEFVLKAESQLAVKFYYKEDWVTDLKLSDYAGCTTLSCILDNLFNGTSLYYLIVDSESVVITKNFTVNASKIPVKNGNKVITKTENTDTREARQMAENLSVYIGNPSDRDKPGNVTVSGLITDRNIGEPITGVNVFIQKLSIGTNTNQYGYYTLTLPRGIHLVKFSFIGMREKNITLNLFGPGEMNIEMDKTFILLKETVISAQVNNILQRFEVGAEKINIRSLKLLPTSMGESDLLKGILLIPGVQSVGEGSAGFNVRGGSADQNLILIYGAPVYNSSHFFGFFSAVNTDIIKDVTLYKGGIPSRLGGRISSVLEIGTKEGNNKEFAGSAGISPITTHLMVEGPLKKNKLAYILTARTTYSDWILKLIDNPILNKSRASFYDLNGTITYSLNKNNKLDLSSYFSHDLFQINSERTYRYNNNIFALKWHHFFSSRFFSSFSINNSFYKYDISDQEVTAEAYRMSHKINSTGLKADLNWLQGRNEINFGLDLNRYAVMPGNYNPLGDSSLVTLRTIERERALEASLYFEDKFILTDKISLNMGMRMSSFFSFGPQTFMIYDPRYSKSRSSVIDTLNFKSGEISKWYAGPELRISLNYRITDNNSLKVNYSRTRQYIHLLSNTISISPTDTWKLCDYYLKPQIGDQFAIGFYQMFFNSRLETSAELYYKQIQNMLDFKGGATLTMDENIEQNLINGRGKAYGLELVLKLTAGKVLCSIGYTYSRTFIKSTGSFPEEDVNSGNWYPASYDKPNDLVVTFNYLYSRRLSFSSSYTWSTGRPVTYPVAIYYIDKIPLVQYSDRNKYRVPDYSRLDISIKVSGNLRSKKIAHPNLTFSVYNLLARKNVYSVYFRNNGYVVNGYMLSVFGKAIPSVTFSFDF